MPKKKTQAEVIADFKAVFGDRYDYSQVHYVNNTTKVIIICHKKDPLTQKEHGAFLVTPKNHKKGRGCPKCASNHPMDTAEFIRKAEHVHKKDNYDYSQVVYKTEHVPVKIICHKKDENGVEHGMFEQDPNAHLKGAGCPKCGLLKNHTAKANELRHRHGVQTNLERYGGTNPMKNPVISRRAQNAISSAVYPGETMDACLTRIYGEGYFTNDELDIIRESWSWLRRLKLSNFKGDLSRLKQTGFLVVTQTPAYRDRLFSIKLKEQITKIKNGTFSASKLENECYDILCDLFGTDDVIRQYISSAYPYPCDFYIRSRNLYIEINGDWVHGDHWFDSNSIADQARVKRFQEKGTPFYMSALNTWMNKDLKKRNVARKNNLNYLVFWDGKHKSDFDLWIADGCPNGKDWQCMYSWLPRYGELKDAALPSHLGSPVSFSMMARYYQWPIFFKNELAMLKNDNGDLLLQLMANRFNYDKKLPEQLTKSDMMRAFKLAHKWYGYSSFNTVAMSKVIEKYNIQSVVDPCAGWGERMLNCYYLGVKYFGFDINSALETGYKQMKSDWHMTQQHIHFRDSQTARFPKNIDALITCPPYYNLEIYSNKGVENKPYSGFLRWWRAIGKKAYNANIKYFCFQVNTEYANDMLLQIQKVGYRLIDVFNLPYKNSPFSKNNDKIKKYKREKMLVLQRID